MVRAARGATRSTEERGGATHTLLTHIEIKCEEALKNPPTAATVHRAEVRKESFSWFVQRSSLLLHSWSDRLPLQIRDCMLMMMMVRWSHKGVVLLLLLKGAQTKKMSVLRPFQRVSGNGVTFARRVSSTLVGLLTICFTAETSRLSGAARAPCLHQSRRVWIAFVVTRTRRHFLPAQSRSPIGPPAGHVFTRG